MRIKAGVDYSAPAFVLKMYDYSSFQLPRFAKTPSYQPCKSANNAISGF